MGMFDDVLLKEGIKCEKCGNKVTYFQTKQFQCLLDSYNEGQNVSHLIRMGDNPTLEFEVHTGCDKCRTWIYGVGKIKDGIFIGLKEYHCDVK